VRGADIVVWVGPKPTAVVEHVLRSVSEVRVHTTTSTTASPLGAVERVELVRAGAPTFVRRFVRRHA
jgi:hypothetical protein